MSAREASFETVRSAMWLDEMIQQELMARPFVFVLIIGEQLRAARTLTAWKREVIGDGVEAAGMQRG